MVTPDTEVAEVISTSSVDNTGRRTFTLENPVVDAEHQLAVIAESDVTIDADGQVTLEATSGAADLTASSAVIELVGGSSAGQQQATDVTPTTGDPVDVVIDSQTADESVVLIVWFDADEDGNLDVDADGAPTEPFGVSGVTNYIFAESADIATATSKTVVGADLDANYFYDSAATFYYSDADTFRYQAGANVSIDVFEGMLTANDVIDVTYDQDGASLFNVTTDSVPAPADVEAEITAEATDDNTVALTWTASDQGDVTYTITRDDGNAGADVEIADGVTGTTYTDTGVADLTSGDAGYVYTVTAVASVSEQTSTTISSDALFVPAADEVIALLANGAVVDVDAGTTGEADTGDELVMYFDGDAVVDASAALEVTGTAGGSAIIENGVNATVTASGEVVTISLTADLEGTAALTYPLTIDTVAGIESVDGVLATVTADTSFETGGPELIDSTITAGSTTIVLEFNEALIEVTAENVDNYTYDQDGAGTGTNTIDSATLGADGRTVTLVVDVAPASGGDLSVTTSVLDTEGQAAAAATITAA